MSSSDSEKGMESTLEQKDSGLSTTHSPTDVSQDENKVQMKEEESSVDMDECQDNNGFVRRRMTMPASTSEFMRTLSEDAKMGIEAAEELERRLKDLVSAFSARTRRAKERIAKPPTPTLSDSEDEGPAEDDDLLSRLKKVCFQVEKESETGIGQGGGLLQKGKAVWGKLQFRLTNFLACQYIIDSDGWVYVIWLMVVASCFLYNAVVIPLRAVFPYQTRENVWVWQILDYLADAVYIFDIIAFKCHRKFLSEGFWIKDPIETRKSYFKSLQFKIDLACLLPLDILTTIVFDNYSFLRLPRLLKVDSYWELFQRLDTILASPHSARFTKTFLYMLYMIHVNACIYYAVSHIEGLCATQWTFCSEAAPASAYVRCFYFATKTATSIGKMPKPENRLEWSYMTFAWLSGVFVTAILIGQIRDIIATATKNQNDYRVITYAAVSYLHRLGVPPKLEEKVKLWLSYTWEQQKTLDESKILDLIPDKTRTDVALDLHVQTLSKVKLFHHCEVPFLRELVVKLKSIIFLPGDYICKKGEVGREMFIIQSGKINVIGGPSGTQILVTLGEGSVFGEIALLGIGGMNKRTADVKAAGFANLFVLHKSGLEEAIKDYPVSQEIIKKKAKKLMKDNLKKARDAAAALAAKDSAEGAVNNLGKAVEREEEDENEIIKTKEEPRLIETMKQIFPPQTKIGRYLTRGSTNGPAELEFEMKANNIIIINEGVPSTEGIIPTDCSLELDISIMTGDSEDSISVSEEADLTYWSMGGSGDCRKVVEFPEGSSCSDTEDADGTPIQGDKPLEGHRRKNLLDEDANGSLSTSRACRENLPIMERPKAYPVLSADAEGDNTEEDSKEEGILSEATQADKSRGERENKEIASTFIATRFITALKSRAPLTRQLGIERQQSFQRQDVDDEEEEGQEEEGEKEDEDPLKKSN